MFTEEIKKKKKKKTYSIRQTEKNQKNIIQSDKRPVAQYLKTKQLVNL